MSCFNAEITLVNARDAGNAEDGLIPKAKVRTVTVNALVDTGAFTLVIPETICRQLGLAIKSKRSVTVAGGAQDDCNVTDGVEIHWKDRDTIQQAIVLPGEEDVLLGALPLEAMDLMVDPVHERLVGVHGDKMVGIVK
jgi:clan AA aspartic protease